MSDELWRIRLAEALDASGMTARAASLKAKCGPGYIHSILKEGKDPTISKLSAVAEALGASLVYILHGYEVTAEDEEIVAALKDENKRDAIAALLRSSST